MDFRVLGPFEVLLAQRRVELRGEKRRGLLAFLLMQRGVPCSIDRITDALWDEESSRGAAGTVQTYVSQLRKTLDAETMLVTGPGGYVLTIAPGALDADRFEHLLSRSMTEDNDAQRLALLDEALRLWRGPPLAEFAGATWADEPARRWDRLYVVAHERRVDALLDLGRHGEALPQLESAVASHPLHERFWVQLAVAQYRCGDPTLALATCRDARRTLAQELGVDPGPELQALEQRILAHDVTLRWKGDDKARRRPSQPMPSGIVTFLVTDIDRSARLWEIDAGSMSSALERHDRIISDAVQANGGNVFKRVGDGVLAAFSKPTAAVAAAVDAQRALLAEPWETPEPLRSRMALHAGEAVIERDGDYFGPVLNRCSRLLALGHGGQILVTGIVSDALRDHPVDSVTVEPLGEHRLRDLAEPERIAQVLHADIPVVRSTLRITEIGTLPLPVSALVGREAELQALVDAVPDHALTTIVGPGGIGKTRLSLEVASAVEYRFGAAVWFVDLAPVADGSLIASEIASVLAVVANGGDDATAALCRHLAERDALLILDNCEHVVDGVASVVAQLLVAARSARVLVTSRQPLEISGEHVFRLGPLPVDGGDGVPSAAELLFRQRARAVAPGFGLDGANADIVRALCVRLEGVPLALELAAARVRSLQPADLLARLDDRFRLLRSSRRDQRERHQTLHAAVEWSYDLLTCEEQEFFNRLSVFRGGFDLQAAEELGSDIDDDVVDVLDRLVSRSLVMADTAMTTSRFRMLETLREYASERLTSSGIKDEIEARHARLYLMRESEPTQGIDVLEHDIDNLSAAVNWLVIHEPEEAARCVLGVWERFALRSRLLEVQLWLESLIERIDPFNDALAARLLERLGDTCFQTGVRLPEAIDCLERALEIRERQGEIVRAARVRVRLARNLSGYPQLMDIERALQHLVAAEPVLEELGDERRLGEVNLMKASTSLYARRNRDGVQAARAAARLAERNGLDAVRLYAQAQIGVHLGYCGDVEEGFATLEQAWDDADVAGETFARFLAAWMRGFGAILLCDPRDAITWFGRERAQPEAGLAPLQSRTLDSMLALAHMKMGDASAARAIPPEEVTNSPQLGPLLATVGCEWHRAERLLNDGLAVAQRRGDRNEWSQHKLAFAELQARMGDVDAARRAAGELLTAMRDEPSPYYELPARALLARMGDQPAEQLAACAHIMEGHDYRGLTASVMFAKAEVAARDGDEHSANTSYEDALDLYRRFSLRLDEAQTLASWSRALAGFGRTAASSARADECRDVLDNIGAPAWRRHLLDDGA